MAPLEAWTLLVHIGAGAIAVLAGLGALVTTKGGRRHRQAGKLFLVSMGVVVVTVFGLLAVEPTRFRGILALIAIFSGYFAFSGYRVLSRKRPADDAHAIDWTATAAVILACLGLGIWGMDWYLDGQSFGIVMMVFGGIGVGFGSLDAREFSRE
jgi:multisubunit Na+/H+ antiporter MnhF subunit